MPHCSSHAAFQKSTVLKQKFCKIYKWNLLLHFSRSLHKNFLSFSQKNTYKYLRMTIYFSQPVLLNNHSVMLSAKYFETWNPALEYPPSDISTQHFIKILNPSHLLFRELLSRISQSLNSVLQRCFRPNSIKADFDSISQQSHLIIS